MMDSEIVKLAESAILQLKEENKQLKEELEHIKTASSMAFDLFKDGIIVAEQIESTIDKFASKTPEELEITKKAFEFTKTAEYNIFTLSKEESNLNNLDAATKFVNALLAE